jgi:hypothetical protein
MREPNFDHSWKEGYSFELNFSTCVMEIMPVTVVWIMAASSVSGIEQESIYFHLI